MGILATQNDTVKQVEANLWDSIMDFISTYQTPINILIIIVVSVLANWVLRVLLTRTVNQIVRGVKKSQDVDTTSEMWAAPYANARAVQRTRTLGTVGRTLITWIVVVIAAILILGQLGVNLAALLTSAGIVTAGLAFGAQNLVKDVLNGIFMVFEDQVGVGDSVRIGDVSGTVEDVGIRITQVRADDGVLWFVRNGEILTLGNSSQGWGRAIIDVTVVTDQDLSQVADVSLEAARTLLTSDRYARKVTGEPEVRGLEAVYGDRATLRLTVRTRPEAQWEVQRGIRAEIIRKFDEEGIRLAAELPKQPGQP